MSEDNKPKAPTSLSDLFFKLDKASRQKFMEKVIEESIEAQNKALQENLQREPK